MAIRICPKAPVHSASEPSASEFSRLSTSLKCRLTPVSEAKPISAAIKPKTAMKRERSSGDIDSISAFCKGGQITGTDTNKLTIAPEIPIQKLSIVNPTIRTAIAVSVIKGTAWLVVVAELPVLCLLISREEGRVDMCCSAGLCVTNAGDLPFAELSAALLGLSTGGLGWGESG